MRRILNFLIMHDVPDWIDREYLTHILSADAVPSIASLRAWIALVDEGTMSAMCPPRRRCYGDEVRAVADKVMDKVLQEIRGVSAGPVTSRAGELLSVIDEVIDEGLEGVEPVECTELRNLGCFIPADERVGKDEPEELARYPGPLILVNMEGIEGLRSRIIERLGGDLLSDWEQEVLGRRLLEAVVGHEVTHAYTDLAHEGAPARELRGHRQRLYYEVIEESLATYYGPIQYLDYDNVVARIAALELLRDAPIEYRAGLLWHTMMYAEHVDEILEKWVTGTSLGMLDTFVILTLPLIIEPGNRLRDLIEDIKASMCPLPVTLGKLPTPVWKLIALELVRSAKPGSLLVNTPEH